MSDKPDLSVLLSMLSKNDSLHQSNPEELLANLLHSSSDKSNTHSPDNAKEIPHSDDNAQDISRSEIFNQNLPDMEMIMKLMKIMQSTNQNSPSKDLLKSLKPFLNDSRKEKVDQYIKLLGMTKALEIFNESGDHPK